MKSNYYKLVYMQDGKFVEILLVHERELKDYANLMNMDSTIKGGYVRNDGDKSVTWLKR